MCHFGSLATMFLLVLSFSTLLGGRGQIRDCPVASLRCEKSVKKDSEYICRASAPQPSVDDPPRFTWSVTAGKVVEGPNDATRKIDVAGVDAEVVTVIVSVKWKLPGCNQGVSSALKLR